MRGITMLIGILALIAGIFFACQGAGYIHWPAVQPGQFTMVNSSAWIYRGGAIAVIGLIVILLARRR